MNCRVADSDGVVFARHTEIANIDIIAASSQTASLAADCDIVNTRSVVNERGVTNARIAGAGGILKENAITVPRISIGAIAPEHPVPSGRIEVAANIVRERIIAIATIEKPADVPVERINAMAGVPVPVGIGKQGSKAGGGIVMAGGVVIERLKTQSGVPHAGGQACQGPVTEKGVPECEFGVRGVRGVRGFRNLRVRFWQSPKQASASHNAMSSGRAVVLDGIVDFI